MNTCSWLELGRIIRLIPCSDNHRTSYALHAAVAMIYKDCPVTEFEHLPMGLTEHKGDLNILWRCKEDAKQFARYFDWAWALQQETRVLHYNFSELTSSGNGIGFDGILIEEKRPQIVSA